MPQCTHVTIHTCHNTGAVTRHQGTKRRAVATNGARQQSGLASQSPS